LRTLFAKTFGPCKIISVENQRLDNKKEISPALKKSTYSPLFVIFMTVFIDLVGFGIIIPLSPYLAKHFQATPTQIGFLMAIYSVMQFIFSPLWGSWSDRIGRRPIILISLLGGSLSYLLFAFASSLWVLFLARGLAGVFGGSISTAHAYIADVTSEKDRSKGMGLLGAAFGLGFIFGPLIGGLLGAYGQTLGSEPPFGMSLSALGAAVLCFANFVFAFFVLKESLSEDIRLHPREKRARFQELARQAARPQVGMLIGVFFLSGLAMAQMESMLFPYVADVFKWNLRTSSYGFAYVGVLMVITQGYLIRKWMPKYGEPKILSIGLLLFALSLFGIGFSHTVLVLGVTMTILAVGNGMMRPPNVGLISLLTPANEQGAVMGVTNSVASLGRIIGPIIGGVLYERAGRASPFLFAGILAMMAFALILSRFQSLPKSGRVVATEL
jgi:DHA1 family tetracycline resistance protein-like MFS transporter